ncbi:ABC transporter ATP-binding protein [Candidatus Darwinibacter acetoxidans]|jgi:iron(III) transport system ATP-binding protein|nr:ABC transporter ATP-binding protein [Bacillota bacterium]HBG08447.1 ABC transporter ATP-binding protein [Bacillota bacterium]
MSYVRFENVSFAYGDNQILKNFSLALEKNEIMCLVGPSGCGKTTLVRCLLGLNRPSEGEIYVGDTCVFSSKRRINVPAERRRIGIVFQDYAVWPHLTVKENIAYPLRKRKVPKPEIDRRVEEVLRLVRMSEYINHLPSQLSGGQQQRVAIARALMTSDDLVVMDEPITNLDAKLREQMLYEIRELQHNMGTTVFYITHDQRAALQLGDRIAIMDPQGELVQVGSDEDIILRPRTRFVFEFIGVTNFLALKRVDGQYRVDLGSTLAPWPAQVPPELQNGAVLDVGIRPNDIVFDSSSPFRGVVRRAVFLGSEYEYFVQAGDKSLRIQQGALDASLNGIAAEGSEVGLNFLNPQYYEAAREEGAR